MTVAATILVFERIFKITWQTTKEALIENKQRNNTWSGLYKHIIEKGSNNVEWSDSPPRFNPATGECRLSLNRFSVEFPELNFEDVSKLTRIYMRLVPYSELGYVQAIRSLIETSEPSVILKDYKLRRILEDASLVTNLPVVQEQILNVLCNIIADSSYFWKNGNTPTFVTDSQVLKTLSVESHFAFSRLYAHLAGPFQPPCYSSSLINTHLHNMLSHCTSQLSPRGNESTNEFITRAIVVATMISSLLDSPKARNYLIFSPMWLGPPEKPFAKASQICNETFLGRLIRITPLNIFPYGDEQAVSANLLMEISKYFRANSFDIRASDIVATTLHTHNAYMGVLTEIMKKLIKDNSEVKTCTINWLIKAVQLSSKQAKLQHRYMIQNLITMPHAFQRIFFETENVWSPYASLNLGMLMLSLFSPINIDGSRKIELEQICSRGFDSEDDWDESNNIYKTMDACVPLGDTSTFEVPKREVRPLKFVTIITWLAIQSIRNIITPVVLRLSTIQRKLSVTMSEDASHRLIELFIGQRMLLLTPFTENYIRLLEVITALVYRTLDCPDSSGTDLITSVSKALPQIIDGKLTISIAYQMLPSEELAEAFQTYKDLVRMEASMKNDPKCSAVIDRLFSAEHAERLLSILILFLSAPSGFVRIPTYRLDIGGHILEANFCIPAMRKQAYDSHLGKNFLPSAIIRGFVEAGKLQYVARCELRVILAMELKEVFSPRFSKTGAIDEFRRENTETYEKFLSNLADFMSWTVEESLSLIMEIKERPNRESARPTTDTDAQQPSVAANADDDGIAEALQGTRAPSSISLEELTERCKNLMSVARNSMEILASLDVGTYSFICSKRVVLTPAVLAINSCLNSLIGPKCLALKVSNMEEYNFKPRELLHSLLIIYTKLAGTDENQKSIFSQALLEETRFFSASLFKKAIRVATRENLCSPEETFLLGQLYDAIDDSSKTVNILDLIIAECEVPDEYLDPLMACIMTDPVILPTSGHILDRSVIERHLITEEFDPFNRAPLTRKDLIPEIELKQEIEAFIVKCTNDIKHNQST